MPHSQHLVFVYGGLRRGFTTNDVLEKWGGEHVAEASYPQGHSRMVSLGAMPGLIPDSDGPFIMGDLYRLSWPALIALDKLECAPHFFRRVKAKVQTSEGEDVRAWLYVLANPSRFSDAKVVECGDWKVFQSSELQGFLSLVDKARKGEQLPKEYAVNESATCAWSPSTYKGTTTSTTSSQRPLSLSGPTADTETKRWEDEWTRTRELREKRLGDIRSEHEQMQAKLKAKENKITLANKVFGGKEVLPDKDRHFAEDAVRTINSLEKGRGATVRSRAGSIVTFKRNHDNVLEVVDWHAGQAYVPGNGFQEQPAKDLENLQEYPEKTAKQLAEEEAVDDKPDIVAEYDSEAVSECVFCNEQIEYVPTVGWVGENLSPQCLVAPAVSDTTCHAAPAKGGGYTFDPEWGEGAND